MITPSVEETVRPPIERAEPRPVVLEEGDAKSEDAKGEDDALLER